jgi:hypothetical protein
MEEMADRHITCLEILDKPPEERDKVLCPSNVSWDSLFEQVVWESYAKRLA